MKMPGIAWVALLAAVLVAGGLFGLYATGRHAGKVQAHKVALADSVVTVHAKVKVAEKRSDAVVQVARNWRAQVAKPLPASVQADLDSSPPSIRALVAQKDTALLAAHIAIDTLLRERLVRVEADTLEAHKEALGAPDDGMSVADVAKVTVVVVGVITVVKFALSLVHR